MRYELIYGPNQNSITAVDAEAAELNATRAVYDMLKPLGCEAQTRVLHHVYLPSSSGSAETRSEMIRRDQITGALGQFCQGTLRNG
jgi:hypothetical protein